MHFSLGLDIANAFKIINILYFSTIFFMKTKSVHVFQSTGTTTHDSTSAYFFAMAKFNTIY